MPINLDVLEPGDRVIVESGTIELTVLRALAEESRTLDALAGECALSTTQVRGAVRRLQTKELVEHGEADVYTVASPLGYRLADAVVNIDEMDSYSPVDCHGQ
jgi:predicted transcriptional regulator